MKFSIDGCTLIPRGRAVWGVDHDCLDTENVGSSPPLRHGCLSSSFCVVLFCVGRGLCDGLITSSKGALPSV
jgi:hypothetical protein